MNAPRVILDAAYVFARNKPRKPAHVEIVKLQVRGTFCVNGCGLYFIAPTDEDMKPDDVCPDCSTPPKSWAMASEAEEVEIQVRMAFGNVVDWSFLRALGPVSRRAVQLPVGLASPRVPLVLPSRGIVRPPQR